jgi:hypothetical protein
MKVEFDATLDDCVDATLRMRKRSRALRVSYWKIAGAFALLLGVTGFINGTNTFWWNLAWACRDAALCGGLFMILLAASRPWEKSRIRKFYREIYATDGPLRIEVEISDTGLSLTQCGAQVTREWKSITSIEEHGDAIEFWHNGGLTVIRNRAFSSPEQRGKFLALCRKWTAPPQTS